MSDHSLAEQFAEAANSLKLYRRADLFDYSRDRPLIEDLYVDPLPDNEVFNSLLRPNTTFLVGRKGSGKSNVFQRAQHEIRKGEVRLSVYLDIETIFEGSQPDPIAMQRLQSMTNALAPAAL